MPAPLGKADLKILPNADEIAEAKRILAGISTKDKKAKMSAMVSWLKSHPDEVVKNSRGAEREQYLAAFVAHQLRARTTVKKLITTETKDVVKGSHTDFYEWSSEQMDQNLGEKKGLSWRESGLLHVSPCPLTGSNEDHLKVYRVPVNWQSCSESDLKRLRLEASGDANADDLELMQMNTPGEACDAGPKVKKEEVSGSEDPPNPEEVVIQHFKTNARDYLRRYQDLQQDTKDMMTVAPSKPYTEAFVKDLASHDRQLGKAVKILQRSCHTLPTDEQITKLLKGLQQCTSKQSELTEWAVKFNIIAAPSKGKHKRSRGA